MSESSHLLWTLFALLASLTLLHMMRRRQLALVRLLQEYVKRQQEWAEKRAKAAQLARNVAQSRASEPTSPTSGAANSDAQPGGGTAAADPASRQTMPLDKEKLAAVITEQIASGA